VLPLARLFVEIDSDPTAKQFHPHPFSADVAAQVCQDPGLDWHFGLLDRDRLVAYGLLRGWNEGYEVPSLGIYVVPDVRGTGVSRLMMHYLHVAARVRGATRIRLKVYAGNVAALRLYQSLGYAFVQSEGEQLVGYLTLVPAMPGAPSG
jgi:RimJ/RimL family protein N-acetyltransferase